MVGTSILIVLNDHFLFSDGSAAITGVAGVKYFTLETSYLGQSLYLSFPHIFLEPGLSKNQMMFSAEIL